MERRKFIKNTAAAIGGLAIFNPLKNSLFSQQQLLIESNRPSPSNRTFSSPTVENIIANMNDFIVDEDLKLMFTNCFPNTLDTTVDFEFVDGKPDSFIITGDIDAMWLRDSTAQVWPYMPLIKNDPKLANLIKGLINRQVQCVLTDPYANAFYKDLNKKSGWESDEPTPKPGVHERKWEIDSLCYVVRLSYNYFMLTYDAEIFTEDWDRAMRLIVKTLRDEQDVSKKSNYYFIRQTTNMIDAPVFYGTGRPAKQTGMVKSMFRPSDDATLYPFLIPSNAFAVIALRYLGILYQNTLHRQVFADECFNFARQIDEGIKKYAIFNHHVFGNIYSYEVDGFGNRNLMDDANVPSLISLAYLDRNLLKDSLYQNTREFVLSNYNPYFLNGKEARGQASPHTGKENIWPMGIILRALTSTDKSEIRYCLKMLKNTHAGTYFMHESFNKDNPNNYTRSWFAWANTLFGELILQIYNQNRDILLEII